MMKYTGAYYADLDRIINKDREILELLDGKKIYITGATGLICSAVADMLLRAKSVMNLNINIILAGRNQEKLCNRFSDYILGRDYDFAYYDATANQINDIEANYIIHGASNADPISYSKYPVETMLANLIGLNNILRMAADKKTNRVLYISSSEVYGKKDDNNPFLEDAYGFVDILNPRACYPSAKRAAETLCVTYGVEYGVEVVMARPGHIFGATMTDNDSRAAAQFARNAAKGENIVMKSAGDQIRSYCDCFDCASAILWILLKGENSTAYNISSDKSVVTIRELAEEFARIGNAKVVYENPSDVEKRGYNMMSNSSLEASKLKALGWESLFSLEESIKRNIDVLM